MICLHNVLQLSHFTSQGAIMKEGLQKVNVHVTQFAQIAETTILCKVNNTSQQDQLNLKE